MRTTLPVFAMLLLAACPGPVMTPDSGAGFDAGMTGDDAGLSSDAGTDAGVDAGAPPVDAGSPVDAGVPDAGLTNLTIEQWCTARALGECFQAQRCLRVSSVSFDDCVARRLVSCDQQTLTRGVHEGRLAFDAGAAVRCVNEFARGSCSEPPASCAAVFHGLVPPDGGCLAANECDDEGSCALTDGRCPHRCVAWAARDSSCDDDFSIHCDPRRDSCTPRDGGFFQFCQPFRVEGEPCEYFDQCRGDLTCAGNNTCVRKQARLGEACGVSGPYPACIGDSFCRQNGANPGTCVALAGVGGACVDRSSCLPTLRCDAVLTVGTCQPRLALGEACLSFTDCQDELYCSGLTRKCERLSTVDGGDCSLGATGYQCGVGAFCRNTGFTDFACEPKRPVGALCEGQAQQCQSGECALALNDDGGFNRHCIEACTSRADGGF